MYSQNNEEEIILNYFQGKQGKFMDIGAFNPFIFSNTRRLYELGWKGVFVEPSPICFNSFIDEYKKDIYIDLVNKAVVTDDSKELEFYEASGDAVSTSSVSHRDLWLTAGIDYKPIKVKTIHINDLINQYGVGINFLNVDVEAMNYDLFCNISNDFLSSLEMICIEHDKWFEQIESRMEGLGFNKLLINPENIILAKNER